VNDFDGIGLGIIAYGASRAASSTRQGAEYQRQQLNLLRRHQGLAPIPPDYSGPSYFFTRWIGASILLTAALFVPLFTAPENAEQPVLWHLLASFGMAIGAYAWLSARLNVARQRARERFYRSWERAGCP
jgi:hypothetical protein